MEEQISMEQRRKEPVEQKKRLRRTMSQIKHKIAVISGKGGVDKSTITANLAMAFAIHGYVDRVGILDVDIHTRAIYFWSNLHV